ncbi:MAG: CBS domain-containing protein [Acidobacteriia bacterium]|jgi:CBS domain-containing protein|nr:CBS domain-containing protein [Terriglobia bacterium]
MGRIGDVLLEKGDTVHTIESAATVFDAVKRMVDVGVGALLVTDGGKICGMITERDYLRRIAVEGRTSRTTLVREIMSSPVVCIESSADVAECMALMTHKRIRHLPVVDHERLVGLVSIGDLVRAVSKEHSFHVQVLTDYIAGKYPA